VCRITKLKKETRPNNGMQRLDDDDDDDDDDYDDDDDLKT
jgi:hypothetical protein